MIQKKKIQFLKIKKFKQNHFKFNSQKKAK